MTSTLTPSSAFAGQHVFGEPKLHTDGDVQVLGFARDGALLSVEEPGVLRRWNAETGQPLEWNAISDFETLWAFSGDARVLASASDDLTIWDASSGQVLTAIRQESWVAALAFHPDAGFVATGHDDGSIRYWDAAGHHLVFDKPLRFHTKAISALAISRDGKLLAAAGEDKLVSVWDLATGERVSQCAGHTDRIPALAWHPDGVHLVSAGWDTTARVWNARTGEPVILLNSHSTQVTALAFNADGSRLACADSAMLIHVWDFAQRKCLHKLQGPEAEIRTLAFSPDGRRLAANGDRMIHLWDVATGQPLIGAGPRPVTPTSVAVHGSKLVSNGGGSAARVWNIDSRTPVVPLDTAGAIVHAVAFRPDGRVVAGACGATIRLWDASTGAQLASWEHEGVISTRLAFSPDGKLLASANDRGEYVWIWSVADGEPVLHIQDALQGCAVTSLAFHPKNADLLAVGGIDVMSTGGSDGAVSLWNLSERAEVASIFEGCTSIAFDPTGARVTGAIVDHTICLWNLADEQLLNELVGHESEVACVAFSPDGKLIASGSADHTLRLWSIDGDEIASLEVDSQITSLTFAPDGRSLFAGHANTTSSQIVLK